MRSCCFGCEHVDEDKHCRRCVQCERRLALLDRLDYMAQDRRHAAECYPVGRAMTRYYGQPEAWAS